MLWAQAARPRTLPAVVVPVVLGSLLAYREHSFSMLVFFACLSFGVLIQIGTNLANDLFDFLKGADTESRIGPLRLTQAGLISVTQMKFATALELLCATLVGLRLAWIGGMPMLAVVICSVSLALLYTAGPFPIAYHGLGDVFCLIFFGPVPLGVTYYLHTRTISPSALITGASLGLLSTAILVVNNIRDCDTDRAAGKSTLVVRFGRGFGRLEFSALLISASVLSLLLLFFPNTQPGASVAALFLLFTWRTQKTIWSTEDGARLNGALSETAQFLILYAALFILGCLL